MGKGDGPRESQYSRKTQEKYSIGYDRAFGKESIVCEGTGRMERLDKGAPFDGPCSRCNGTGRIK